MHRYPKHARLETSQSSSKNTANVLLLHQVQQRFGKRSKITVPELSNLRNETRFLLFSGFGPWYDPRKRSFFYGWIRACYDNVWQVKRKRRLSDRLWDKELSMKQWEHSDLISFGNKDEMKRKLKNIYFLSASFKTKVGE